MFMKQFKPRKFVYRPYYYRELKDEEHEGPRIKFRRKTRGEQPRKKSILTLVLLLIILLYLLRYFGGLVKQEQSQIKIQNIKVETLKEYSQ